MTTVPLSAALVVGVSNFDVYEPVRVSRAAELRGLLNQHQLLPFRHQKLSAEKQLSFLQNFGHAIAESPNGPPGLDDLQSRQEREGEGRVGLTDVGCPVSR